MKNVKSYFLENYSLGDLAATLYSLENMGMQRDEEIVVQINGSNSNLYECFDFKHVRLGESDNNFNEILKSNHVDFCKRSHCGYFYKNYNFISVLLNHLVNFFGYDPKLSKPIVPKKGTIGESSGKVYVQFDGRTTSRQNRDMKLFQKINVLKDIPDWSCLGGTDTVKYLGREASYELGDIHFIVGRLSSSKGFVGCDSGISHIAGCMGVESKVYISGRCYHCLNNYYASSYRNCHVVRPSIKLI